MNRIFCIFSGAKAAATKRSSKLSEYIRKGCSKATIRIHLYNADGMNDHKRDIFGDRIIVQRELLEKGGGGVKLFNQYKKEICQGKEATEELQNILSKMFIDVDNSVTIMHQEECKNFFAQANPEKLFGFYMNGTLLARIKRTNEQSQQDISHIDGYIVKRKKDVVELTSKKEKCEDAMKIFEDEEVEKNDQVKVFAWAKYVNKHQPAAEKAQKELEIAEEKLKSREITYEAKKAKYQEKSDFIDELKTDIASLTDKINQIKKQNEEGLSAKEILDKRLRDIEDNNEQVDHDMKNSTETIKTLKGEIRKSKMDVNKNRNESEAQEREVRQNELEAEKTSLEQRKGVLEQKMSSLGKLRFF